MKTLYIFITAVMSLLALPAQGCDKQLTVIMPLYVSADFKLEGWLEKITQIQRASAFNCLNFRRMNLHFDEADGLLRAGQVDAIVLPLSWLARTDERFAPLAVGYRFKNAGALKAEFEEIQNSGGTADSTRQVMDLIIGKPKFPVFTANTYQNRPEFSSSFEIVSKPDGAKQLSNADAVLSVPTLFSSSAVMVNKRIFEDLADRDQSKVRKLLSGMWASMVEESNDDIERFFEKATDSGFKVMDLDDQNRTSLFEGLEARRALTGSNSVRLFQCSSDTCPCSGGNLCTSGCCKGAFK